MNKLMARIVAVVLAVMMLGTVSFAADATLDAEKNTITTNAVGSGYKTVKATAGGTIIALFQGDEVPESIEIDSEKIGNNKKITVMYGGLNTGIVTQDIDVPADKEEPIKVDVKTDYVTQDGTKYKDAAHVTNSFTVETGKQAIGFGYNVTATDGTKTVTKKFEKTGLNISGGGTFKYDVVFLGVPAGVTITAEGFVNY